jgi:hypothetical protein
MSKRDDLHIPVRRALEKDGWTITSLTNELQTMMGQLQLYQWALDENDPERELFLAVSMTVYDSHIQDQNSLFSAIVGRKRINLIVFDDSQEVILQWIRH